MKVKQDWRLTPEELDAAIDPDDPPLWNGFSFADAVKWAVIGGTATLAEWVVCGPPLTLSDRRLLAEYILAKLELPPGRPHGSHYPERPHVREAAFLAKQDIQRRCEQPGRKYARKEDKDAAIAEAKAYVEQKYSVTLSEANIRTELHAGRARAPRSRKR